MDPLRSWRDARDGPLPEQGLTHAHFKICALTSILRPRGRLPLRDDGGHWFSDPPGEKRWVIFLSCRATLRAGLCCTSQAHDEMGQDFECFFSFLPTHGLNAPARSFGTGTPSTLLWSFVFLSLDPPLPPCSPAEDRPLHIISQLPLSTGLG